MTTRYQAQAVLRRDKKDGPVKLAGVVVDGDFYPKTAADAKGRLDLTKGRVALAPLAPIDTPEAPDAAAAAMVDAADVWNGPNSPDIVNGEKQAH